jgi:hypothetical protein
MKLEGSFNATVATEDVLWAHHTSTVVAQARGFDAALDASTDDALSYRLSFLFEEMLNIFGIAWSWLLCFWLSLNLFLKVICVTVRTLRQNLVLVDLANHCLV